MLRGRWAKVTCTTQHFVCLFLCCPFFVSFLLQYSFSQQVAQHIQGYRRSDVMRWVIEVVCSFGDETNSTKRVRETRETMTRFWSFAVACVLIAISLPLHSNKPSLYLITVYFWLSFHHHWSLPYHLRLPSSQPLEHRLFLEEAPHLPTKIVSINF